MYENLVWNSIILCMFANLIQRSLLAFSAPSPRDESLHPKTTRRTKMKIERMNVRLRNRWAPGSAGSRWKRYLGDRSDQTPATTRWIHYDYTSHYYHYYHLHYYNHSITTANNNNSCKYLRLNNNKIKIHSQYRLYLSGGQVHPQYFHGLREFVSVDGAAVVPVDLGEDGLDTTRRLRTWPNKQKTIKTITWEYFCNTTTACGCWLTWPSVVLQWPANFLQKNIHFTAVATAVVQACSLGEPDELQEGLLRVYGIHIQRTLPYIHAYIHCNPQIHFCGGRIYRRPLRAHERSGRRAIHASRE